MSELPKNYDPAALEPEAMQLWLDAKAFAATPDPDRDSYVVMMPLPNVTGALHMGHAMDNVMQDLLTRWHRMLGHDTLWQPGTDHAGIATQQVVETRLFELEGKTRHDVGRAELVRRIWEWKDQYQARIIAQQQKMGCSCDWDRQRFTMDAVCARAVRYTFFRMFDDGLIYRGDRLVNWDCKLHTAVADDELYKATVQGHFWHLRYPVVDPRPGEPTHVVVATTRPETMLADTAVACHPEPRTALEAAIARAEDKLRAAPQRERAAAEQELAALQERRSTHLPQLETIAAMARDGRRIRLPLMEREIPLILDEWAKPELGSGCVKITPGHDPNDYDVWTRHKDRIGLIGVMAIDGTINEQGGAYRGLDRFVARERVVADLTALGLVERIEDRELEVDHSDRSKSIVEPFVSKQWFVAMGDRDGGIVCGRGTAREFMAAGLAQAAIDAASGVWKSATGRGVAFHPDQERYHKMYHQWLAEKRDWCISRQLWWGHRIPVWKGRFTGQQLANIEGILAQRHDGLTAWCVLPDGTQVRPLEAIGLFRAGDPRADEVEALVCIRDEAREEILAGALRAAGLEPEEDVLDTWFSSALWPHSTLGWPDPTTAAIGAGQTPLGAVDGRPDSLSNYYPGSCLVTGRDIITLWVARMVVMGLYNLGDVPFTDVFLHATILDGKGERMSKSKGNGVDPNDVVEAFGADAMRYVLCEMQTGTQDIRLPVQVISPVDGVHLDLAECQPGPYKGTFVDPRNGQLFDMVGQMERDGVPGAKATSDRFEIGRAFCNKLWNAARFAFMNLTGTEFVARDGGELTIEDRWILSRLTHAIQRVDAGLAAYNPSAAIGAAREFFWNELCDWYLELIKPRMRDAERAPLARQVLATCLDQVLRLLHPFVPFVTEILWRSLGELAPRRGIVAELGSTAGPLVRASFPAADAARWRNEGLEVRVALAQEVVASLREVRARYQVAPSRRVPLRIRAQGASAEALAGLEELIAHMAGGESVLVGADATATKDSATAVVRDVECHVLGVVDPDKERAKLETERDALQKRIAGVNAKLGNAGFVAKAPQQVVEQERARLAELEQQLATLQARLRVV
ncbi:MAG: valine--tRNA ligase [Planctomycetes bacterium]|nr:valine--tRNA ligase [Planctomycetota bacterium]